MIAESRDLRCIASAPRHLRHGPRLRVVGPTGKLSDAVCKRVIATRDGLEIRVLEATEPR